LVAAAALGGCGPREIVVLSLPLLDDGGLPFARPCTRDADCDEAPGGFCQRETCSDPVGRCETRPLVCDSTPGFVCGCDRVTYWNRCMRRQHGVAADVDGECALGSGCDATLPCPAQARCSRLLSENATCGPTVGKCLVVPSKCGTVAGTGAWVACGGTACVDLCTAAHTEQPHRRASVCP
jgi:hypothetical protein